MKDKTASTTMVKASIAGQSADNPEAITDRRSPGSLDEHYSKLYLDKPWISHKDLYIEACQLAGVAVAINAISAAYELHKRLKLNLGKLLTLQSDSDKTLGRAKLRQLAKGAASESVQAQTAAILAKGLYPDVIISKEQTLEEIETELVALEELERQEAETTAVH